MRNRKYSAGMVSKGFWFQEFRKYIELLSKYSCNEIIELQKSENVFLAPSTAYGIKMVNELTKRINELPEEIIDIFFDLSVSNQMLINLLGVMMTDLLFFEYIDEVLREELIIGSTEYDEIKTRVFLKNKSEKSEQVAKYTEQTKKRLSGAYKTYLREAGVLIEEENKTIIRKPVLDLWLEEKLKTPEMYPYYRALLGVI